MLLAADEMPAVPLTLIERYGSFGLVCVLFMGLVFYVLPRFVRFIESQRAAFTEELKAERQSRDQAHEKCEAGYAKHADAMGQVSAALSKVSDRLERVEDQVRDARDK